MILINFTLDFYQQLLYIADWFEFKMKNSNWCFIVINRDKYTTQVQVREKYASESKSLIVLFEIQDPSAVEKDFVKNKFIFCVLHLNGIVQRSLL